jgi:phosphate transport system substrate-binding protein
VKSTTLRYSAVPGFVALTLALSGCGGDNPATDSTAGGGEGGEVAGEVLVDGSSTVQPLSAAAG